MTDGFMSSFELDDQSGCSKLLKFEWEMAVSVGKFLHQGEVDEILRREQERRRRERLINVRKQSSEFAKQIRTAVQSERCRQKNCLESKIKREWLEQRKRRIEELGKVYGDCLRDVGQGHENAALEIKRKREKENLYAQNKAKSEVRGREAVKTLTTCKMKEANEVKQQIERRELAKALEKKRARAVAILPKKDKPGLEKVKEETDEKMREELISKIPGVALPTVLVMKSHTSDEVNAAMAADAIEEMNRVRELEKAAMKQEMEKKAQQRFLIALKNERIRLDYIRLVNELEQLDKEQSSDSNDTLEATLQKSKEKQELEAAIEELFHSANWPMDKSLSKSSTESPKTSREESCLNNAVCSVDVTLDETDTKGQDRVKMEPILEEVLPMIEGMSIEDESILAGQFNSDGRTLVSDIGSIAMTSDIGYSTSITPSTGYPSSRKLSSLETSSKNNSPIECTFERNANGPDIISNVENAPNSRNSTGEIVHSKTPLNYFLSEKLNIRTPEQRAKSPIETKKLDFSFLTSTALRQRPIVANRNEETSRKITGSNVLDERSERLRELLKSIIAEKPYLVTSSLPQQKPSVSKDNIRLSTIVEVDSVNLSNDVSIAESVGQRPAAEQSSWMNYNWDSKSKISILSEANLSPSFPSMKDLTGTITLSSGSSGARTRSSSSNYASTPLHSPNTSYFASEQGITDEPDLTLVSNTTMASFALSDEDEDCDNRADIEYQNVTTSESTLSFLRKTSELPSRILSERKPSPVNDSLLSFLQHEMSACSSLSSE